MNRQARPLRVVIADDEPLARERLRTLLEGEPGIFIAAECENGLEVISAIDKECPDLLFLDVRMPELDGFQVVEALRPEARPGIIFTTAHDQFALKAFEKHAIDFLLKPFERERLRKSLNHARAVLKETGARAAETAASRRPAVGGRVPPGRLAIKTRGGIVLVASMDIDWLSGADNYTEVHSGKTVHLLRQTLRSLEGQLQPRGSFLRISRSVVVNVERIREIQRKSHGDFTVVLRSGATLPGSRNFRSNMLKLLGPAA